MLSILSIVLPIFALTLVGWLARRVGIFSPQSTTELNRFVVYLALPALLFDIVAKANFAQLWQPRFVAVFAVSTFLFFVLTVAVSRIMGRPIGNAAILGLNASYSNTAFLGFPLLLATLGPASQTLTLIATINTVCVLFALAIVLIEFGNQKSGNPAVIALRVGQALFRNPLVLAPLAGAAVMASGIGVAAPLDAFLKLLGSAASPCALVCLGMFLAEPRDKGEGAGAGAGAAGETVALVALKLFVYPALTLALALWVIPLPAALRHAAVLLAALPTGTGPFMLAEFHRREGALTAKVILASTVLSVGTVTLLLSLLG
ncbi:AEC family transporter [Novosphingobium sp. KA1]|uniref:AEC family transporter n=1 Tax=Novosphingobium sp. (strain KA1) TaxID=164608 RepID=UPI001A90BF0E|nr:AEC family transporter [Novosphingobium sp. KA1]QSR18479.1 transporter [Novosphingobium sp. KA1]